MRLMTVMGSASATRHFDPAAPDSFGPSINRTDSEVDGLLDRISNLLRVQGEYDQGHVAALPWDDAKDLLTVAELLWRHAKGVR